MRPGRHRPLDQIGSGGAPTTPRPHERHRAQRLAVPCRREVKEPSQADSAAVLPPVLPNARAVRWCRFQLAASRRQTGKPLGFSGCYPDWYPTYVAGVTHRRSVARAVDLLGLSELTPGPKGPLIGETSAALARLCCRSQCQSLQEIGTPSAGKMPSSRALDIHCR